MNLNDIFQSQFPSHGNFQPSALGDEAKLFQTFRARWRERWEQKRRWTEATRPGGLRSSFPSVDIGGGWVALETDDDMDFTDYSFYSKVSRGWFRPKELEHALTIHCRGGRVQCDPVHLRRAFNAGLRQALARFIL